MDHLKDLILRVPSRSFPAPDAPYIGLYQESDLNGSVELFFFGICLLSLDRLEYWILRVPLSSLSGNILAIHSPTVPHIFFVDLDRAIYLSWWNNITVEYSALWYI